MGTITVANTNLSEFNVFTDESQIYITPEKDYEFVEVPGLNGRLTFDNHRFKDVTIPVNCFIRENFATNYTNLMNFLYSLSGYLPIQFSNDPRHIRYGLFYSSVKADTGSFIKSGKFTLNFLCKPERYVANVEPIEITTSDTKIYGYNDFETKPIITFYGNGWFKIESGVELSGTFKSFTVTVEGRTSGNKAGIIVDCEQMVCYNLDYTNAGTDVILHNGFPVLAPGANTVTFSTDSTSSEAPVQIQPRWWEL